MLLVGEVHDDNLAKSSSSSKSAVNWEYFTRLSDATWTGSLTLPTLVRSLLETQSVTAAGEDAK